jgi:hypothetical protein
MLLCPRCGLDELATHCDDPCGWLRCACGTVVDVAARRAIDRHGNPVELT